MQLIKVVRRITHVAGPLKTQPLHVIFDGVDEFLVFFFRVGVVETQMADTAKLFGHAEIQTDGFGMANVQVAVRLRRKTGYHAGYPAGGQIVLNDFGNKVMSGRDSVCHSRPFL